jgi:outer membrane protein OmpA-like peptidoglycan-associated protein
MRYVSVILIAAFVIAALAYSPAGAGKSARRSRPDSRALCYIVRPWPLIRTCSCGDSDNDGVSDAMDECPGTPENTKVDGMGCPLRVSREMYEFINTGLFSTTEIKFDFGKADLKPESRDLLGKIGRVLSDWPEAEIEIGGHTDASGTDEFNQTLSEDRAKAVREYLLENFPKLDPDHLRPAQKEQEGGIQDTQPEGT